MYSGLNRVLFIIATLAVAVDGVWVWRGHFEIDVGAYLLLGLVVPLLILGSVFYSRVRNDPGISAMLTGTAFMIVFPACACLLSYLAFTIAGPRIDFLLASMDRAIGFHWLDWMTFAANHRVITGILGLAYNSIVVQTVFLILALGWTRNLDQIYGMCLAISIGATVAIVLWTAAPSFGAFSVYHIPSEVTSKLGILENDAYAHQLASMLRDGPGFISPRDLRGVIGFPSYHTVQAIILAWYIRRLAYVRWVGFGLNALMVLSTIPYGGHHLVDLFAGALVAFASIAMSDAYVASELRRYHQRQIQIPLDSTQSITA